MLILAETKLNHATTIKETAVINSTWNSLHNLAQTPFGRLLIIWNTLIFSVDPISVQRQFIHSRFDHLSSSLTFFLTSIYSKNSVVLKQPMFDFLPYIHPSNVPWICIGDWNCIQSFHDKCGGIPFTLKQTNPLDNFVFSSNLLIIPSNRYF